MRDCERLCEATSGILRQTWSIPRRMPVWLGGVSVIGNRKPVASEQRHLVRQLFVDDRPDGFRQLPKENPRG